MKATPPPLRNDFTFECPNCGQLISVEPSAAGITQICVSCNQVIQIPGQSREEKEPEACGFFAWAERILMKMILGIPRFIFWVIPREILLFLELAFPWLVRLVRVCTLFVIWLVMIFWPFAFNHRNQSSVVEQMGYGDDSRWLVWFCWIWLSLAVCGSFWGISYIVIRKRRSRKKQQAEQAAAGKPANAGESA